MSLDASLAAAERKMPNAAYHAHPALSCSRFLAAGLYTPDEDHWTPQEYAGGKRITGEEEDDGEPCSEDKKTSYDIGTIVHAGYYEPETLSDIYAVRPVVKTKEGKNRLAPTDSKEYAEFALEHPGKIHLHPKGDVKSMAMLSSLRNAAALHEYSMLEVLSTEACYFATCPLTGLELRIKPDCLRINRAGVLINEDLKTTRKTVDPVQMRRTCYDMDYFRRFAWYRYVLELITGQRCISTLLAVQSTNPHESAQYILSDADLDAAEAQNFAALTALAKCIETGNFQPKWKREITVL